ncbi:hypothetical protein JTE90_017758 [Oedothorax gibbosus]|uniref:Uncharacterized protein n=1 Tax=Oedothorax gibbosus TaxID=931172 RepID=A0AAV6UMJ1_9ARAC|nr:hypothetical protein JTE90_017758 [Oedothorax gibbosus]
MDARGKGHTKRTIRLFMERLLLLAFEQKKFSSWEFATDIAQCAQGHRVSIKHPVNMFVERTRKPIIEQFHSIVAKFVGGKRINYSLRRSYNARCSGAVISHNSRSLSSTVHRYAFSKSPGKFSQIMEKRRERKRILSRQKRAKCKRKLFVAKDSSYGPTAQKPDMAVRDFAEKREIFLASLDLATEEREALQTATIGQSNCPMWKEERD